jgi:muconolactone delta-isomerase
LKISLTGVKPPPPPPEPKHVIQVTNQPGVTAATATLEVPPFEEFLKQHPEVQKYPEEAQKQLYNIFLLKTAREKGYSYVMTPSGWAQIPDLNIRVDILSSLKQYTNIPQIAYQVWRATEGKEYERVSLFEAGVRGLTTGFTETVTSIPIVSMFTGPLLRLGALPEPPVGSVPQVAKATTVPTAIEVASTPEKQKAMDVLQPPPQLAVYKTMETAGQIAGAIFQQWWPRQAFETWKSIDVQDVLQRYKTGEKLTLLERLKLETWLHTPEKVWNALAEATSPKVKYEIPKEVEAHWARGMGGEGWSGEAWKTEILSWQEVPKDIAEKLRMVSSKAGWLPVKTPKGVEYVPFAQEGVWYDAARGPSWRWLSTPEAEWVQYTPKLQASGVEWRVWRGLGDYTMFAQYTLGEGLWKGALPKPPIDLGASVEGTVKGVVDVNKILEQAELWKPRLTWIEAHPAVEALKLGGRGMEPLTVVSPMAEVKVPAVPPIETAKPAGLALSTPIVSVPVRATETSFSLPLPVLPSIPIPKEKEEGRREEHPLGPFFPVVVKVPVLEEEKIEPEFRINVPKPRIDFGERREIERFQLFTIPLRFEHARARERLEERLEPLTFAAPAVVEEQARRQAQAVTPIQMMETPQQPSPPSTPSPPAPSSLEWKVRLPGLPYFSPPPASVVYRTPEWRFAKYWRVDWFAEGLKLDFRLGQISRLLAAQAKKGAAPKLETKEEAGERKRRRAKARQVDWFKGGLLGEAKRAKPKKRKRRKAKVGAK